MARRTITRSTVDTNAQLAQAISALTVVIRNLQQQQKIAPKDSVMDPFVYNQPFDLGSRADSNAYAVPTL